MQNIRSMMLGEQQRTIAGKRYNGRDLGFLRKIIGFEKGAQVPF